MPSADGSVEKKKLPLVKLALAAGVLLAVAALVLRGFDLKGLALRGFDVLQQAGPLAFFTAMALLPVMGCPLLAFALTAGPAFGAQLGLGGVLLASAVSIGVNVTVTYWLARRWLRPWLEKLVRRAGHKIPVVEAADRFEVTLLLRITPGPPFFLQNYLLGLAEIPFPTYLAISWTVVFLQTCGVVIFGNSLIAGKGAQATLGVSVLIAVMLVIHIVRRHYAKRKKRV